VSSKSKPPLPDPSRGFSSTTREEGCASAFIVKQVNARWRFSTSNCEPIVAQAVGELRATVCLTAIRHWQGPAFSHTGLGRQPVILRHPIPRGIAAIYATRRRPVVRYRAVVCEQHRPPLARCVREQRSQQDCLTWQRAAM
jgi:hypothetical protein